MSPAVWRWPKSVSTPLWSLVHPSLCSYLFSLWHKWNKIPRCSAVWKNRTVQRVQTFNVGAVRNEISVHHCLDNRDKLPAFSFVCRLKGSVLIWISLAPNLCPCMLPNIPPPTSKNWSTNFRGCFDFHQCTPAWKGHDTKHIISVLKETNTGD